jgi:hypothetical protein
MVSKVIRLFSMSVFLENAAVLTTTAPSYLKTGTGANYAVGFNYPLTAVAVGVTDATANSSLSLPAGRYLIKASVSGIVTGDNVHVWLVPFVGAAIPDAVTHSILFTINPGQAQNSLTQGPQRLLEFDVGVNVSHQYDLIWTTSGGQLNFKMLFSAFAVGSVKLIAAFTFYQISPQ